MPKDQETDFYGKKYLHVYLYVDGENITIEQISTRHHVIECDYSMSYQHSYYATFKGKIYDEENTSFIDLDKYLGISKINKEEIIKRKSEIYRQIKKGVKKNKDLDNNDNNTNCNEPTIPTNSNINNMINNLFTNHKIIILGR